MDRRIDVAVATALFLLGILMILLASQIKLGMMRDPVGPSAAFYVCGAVLALGGLSVIISHLLRWSSQSHHTVRSEGSEDERDYPALAARAWGLFAATIALAALWNRLGFLIAMPLFVVAALWILGKRRPLSLLLIAFLFTASTYIIFAQVLGVRVSVGPLTTLFRSMGWINI